MTEPIDINSAFKILNLKPGVSQEEIKQAYSFDQSIILWDISTGKKINSFAGHRAPISSVSFNSDSQIIASTSTDRALKLWQISTGEELDIGASSGKINVAKFSEIFKSIICATSQGTIQIWQCD